MDQILPPELNDLEFEALRQLAAHPAIRHIPPHIQSRLKDIGRAKEVLGGIVLTRAFPDKIDHILSWPRMQRIRIGRSWSETKQWPRINYRRCTPLA